MKKEIKEILSISRNERIGLLCLIVIIGIILLIKWGPQNEVPTYNTDTPTIILKEALDSTTITRSQKKQNKKQKSKETKHLTTASMEVIKQE